MPGLRRAVRRCRFSALLLLAARLSAQQPIPAPDPIPAPAPASDPAPLLPQDHPYTLHVYADLLQIPALVLDWRGKPSTGIPLQGFQLQLDSGPVFRPTAVHPEANEPLTLALVLDASGAERGLINALPGTPGHGFPRTLLPHDHISVYAFDCRIVKSSTDTAAEIATTHEGIAHVLASPTLHKPDAPTKTCRNTKHLWDALAAAAADLGEQPGRRAILVFSDGEDGGSRTAWETLKDFAIGKSLAFFALREQGPQTSPASSGPLGRGMRSLPSDSALPDDPLNALTQYTGGLLLPTDNRSLAQQLDQVIALLRSRYILQFPRPASDAAGFHHLDVHVAEPGTTIHAAGIAFPVRDATLLNDPTTVPSDTSKMPVMGKHKPGS